MGLNIKNEDTSALVRQLAEMLGTSQVGAVEDAVRHRLAEVRATGDYQRVRSQAILELGAEFRRRLTPAQIDALRHAEDDLYDDAGLPR
ncbi:type II toxin-antitoxin system VapB family antitoxin [Ruania suaedae]|uniref:type II toxin-antitoxin system VapB family antitoxin n=1 Tax=Ruania suaedae TaxID=2897774 RepID=UPI001E5121CC|nr:type II toxin-antitoxin system VapB family antitoxin [Ruania suaedae]UFU04266.1 type II toxin-antitoxin system VapB family antitoxin [Ruania suaedae]